MIEKKNIIKTYSYQYVYREDLVKRYMEQFNVSFEEADSKINYDDYVTTWTIEDIDEMLEDGWKPEKYKFMKKFMVEYNLKEIEVELKIKE